MLPLRITAVSTVITQVSEWEYNKLIIFNVIILIFLYLWHNVLCMCNVSLTAKYSNHATGKAQTVQSTLHAIVLPSDKSGQPTANQRCPQAAAYMTSCCGCVECAMKQNGQAAKGSGSKLASILLANSLQGANGPGSEKAWYHMHHIPDLNSKFALTD